MTRRADWQREIADALKVESAQTAWSLTGPNRLVKVVRMESIINVNTKARAPGYVTQEKYLFRKNPQQIERALGLMPFSLGRGCRIYRLERLPKRGEYTDELTTDLPGGLPFNFADAAVARQQFVEDKGLTVVPYYPPGDRLIPQWDVIAAIRLIHLLDLAPVMFYPDHSINR